MNTRHTNSSGAASASELSGYSYLRSSVTLLPPPVCVCVCVQTVESSAQITNWTLYTQNDSPLVQENLHQT